MTNPRGTFWPSETQELLLSAALEQPSEAVDAWQRARPLISVDELEHGSFALLPLIYRNLSAVGLDDIDLPRLKGIHRRTWVRNNLLVERSKATSAALYEAGIRAELVEGVLIASRFYDELGLRPTSVLDVLTDANDEIAALAALAGAGWAERTSGTRSHGRVRYVFDAEGNACALRTALAVDLTSARTWLWNAGEPHPIAGASIPVPPPTETLFALCVSHARAKLVPNVQWLVDATMVLRADVDWLHLAALAEETGQVERMQDALGYIARLPGPTPPPTVFERLAAIPVGRRQQVAYRCTAGSAGALGGLPAAVAEHLALTAERSPLGVVRAFPGFLRERWDLARNWQIPFAAGQRAARRFVRRGGTA